MSEILRFSWYPHFDTFFRHFISALPIAVYVLFAPFSVHSFAFPCFLCIKALYIDTDGTWYIGNNGKSEGVGANSRIRQSATPNKMGGKLLVKLPFLLKNHILESREAAFLKKWIFYLSLFFKLWDWQSTRILFSLSFLLKFGWKYRVLLYLF